MPGKGVPSDHDIAVAVPLAGAGAGAGAGGRHQDVHRQDKPAHAGLRYTAVLTVDHRGGLDGGEKCCSIIPTRISVKENVAGPNKTNIPPKASPNIKH